MESSVLYILCLMSAAVMAKQVSFSGSIVCHGFAMCCDWIHTSSLSVMPLNHKPTVSSGDLIEFGVHVGLWWIVLCVAQHFEILCGNECSDRSVDCIVVMQTDARGSRNCMRVFWHAGSYCMALENCFKLPARPG